MSYMFEESSFTGDLCPWALENSPGVAQPKMFDRSPLYGMPCGCRESCRDGTLNYNEEHVDCGGDFNCAGGCNGNSSSGVLARQLSWVFSSM
eukprot:53970-Rhodomonas_salina.1